MPAYANILVIDDEETMRDSCQQTLSRDGNRVAVAEDGLTGLAMLKKESFDLVILDLKMPGLNGMEVLKKLSEEHPRLAVVIISGYATVESVIEGMRTGAYDFITKPFTPDSLLMSVKRALEKRKFSQETSNSRRPKPDGEGFFW